MWGPFWSFNTLRTSGTRGFCRCDAVNIPWNVTSRFTVGHSSPKLLGKHPHLDTSLLKLLTMLSSFSCHSWYKLIFQMGTMALASLSMTVEGFCKQTSTFRVRNSVKEWECLFVLANNQCRLSVVQTSFSYSELTGNSIPYGGRLVKTLKIDLEIRNFMSVSQISEVYALIPFGPTRSSTLVWSAIFTSLTQHPYMYSTHPCCYWSSSPPSYHIPESWDITYPARINQLPR